MTSSDSNSPDWTFFVRDLFKALDIVAGGERALGVAVSGGSDSTALLMFAADWGFASQTRIEAVTVDHGLRPEAEQEARAVAHLAASLGVPHTILTWRREDGAKRSVSQAEARDARHNLMAGWAREKSIPVLALGHTQDDRIETFLMRARAGSGWRGLSGPLPSAASPAWPEGRGLRLVRPLLAFEREHLRQALRRRNLSWVEDPSNDAVRFERVRMRQLARRMEGETLAQALRVMDSLAQMRAASLAEARRGVDAIEFSEAEAALPLSTLRDLGSEARLRLVEALVMAAGGPSLPPRTEALARAVQRIAAPADSHIGLTLGGAWLRTDGPKLRVSAAPPRQNAPPHPGPAWDRATALLADPRVEALGVRDNSEPIHQPAGEKDAGK